jgi:DNA-binding MurR/RpiR family transcriptional regulator
MDAVTEVQGIPRALRQTLEVARSQYATVIRRIRWGDGPIYVCLCGSTEVAGLAATYAFEAIPGWPVIARPLAVFEEYSRSLLAPRSVVLIVSGHGDEAAALTFAQKARRRGSTLLLLSSNPEDPLAGETEGTFIVNSSVADANAARVICELSALHYLAILMAKTLKRPNPLWDTVEAEFGQLPSHIEWALVQLSGAIRSLSDELKTLPSLWVVGGGFYHAPAIRAGRQLRERVGLQAHGIEATGFRWDTLPTSGRGEAALFLSNSRCRIKQEIHQSAAQSRVKGVRVLSMTDSGDRELVNRSELAVLTPPLTEVTGSVLTLTLLEWLAWEAGREPRRSPLLPKSKPKA